MGFPKTSGEIVGLSSQGLILIKVKLVLFFDRYIYLHLCVLPSDSTLDFEPTLPLPVTLIEKKNTDFPIPG